MNSYKKQKGKNKKKTKNKQKKKKKKNREALSNINAPMLTEVSID